MIDFAILFLLASYNLLLFVKYCGNRIIQSIYSFRDYYEYDGFLHVLKTSNFQNNKSAQQFE